MVALRTQLRNKLGHSVLLNALVSEWRIISGLANSKSRLLFECKPRRSKMKTLISALALLTLAAGPVFAQTKIQTPQPRYYMTNPNSPCSTAPAFCDGYHGSN
jgi:hypothetical protein